MTGVLPMHQEDSFVLQPNHKQKRPPRVDPGTVVPA